MKRYIASIVCVVAVLIATSAEASIEFSFSNISANIVADAAAGETQLFVVVSDASGGMNLADFQALFTFKNVGGVAMSIADVFFDDGSLLGIASIDDSDAGVSFSEIATPGNLPSANSASPPFVTTSRFSADSDPPVQPNGVNPGETLGILFDLQATQTLGDVYDELASGELRIGIHVQGFDSDGSESFVNNGAIPEAASIIIWGLLATIGVAYRHRRS